MDKFTKQNETLIRNQENIMSSLLVIDRRIQVILNSQLKHILKMSLEKKKSLNVVNVTKHSIYSGG